MSRLNYFHLLPNRCILGVLGILMLVGTLYDIIAVQMNQPKEQEKVSKFKAPSLMRNGVTNSGYIVESEESNISNGVVTDMSNGDMKTHEAIELTVKGAPKEETAERILQPVPTRRGKTHLSRDMKFQTMWYVRPAEAQTSLRIRAV